MRQFGAITPFQLAVALCALLLLVPIGALGHEHLDQTDSQCRLCEIAGSETAVVNDDPTVSAATTDVERRSGGVALVPESPDPGPGAPRAPPS